MISDFRFYIQCDARLNVQNHKIRMDSEKVNIFSSNKVAVFAYWSFESCEIDAVKSETVGQRSGR